MDDWGYDRFIDEDSYKFVRRQTTQNFSTFLKDYSRQLHDIERTLDDSVSNLWDLSFTPIVLQTSPKEKVSLLDLINTKNVNLNKVVLVLASLCQEVSQLCREAEEKFYGALLLYGEGEKRPVASAGQQEDARAQMASYTQIARFLNVLQPLSCFVNRCHDLVKNFVQQLSALFSNDAAHSLFDVQDLLLPAVVDRLGQLLLVLVTLDHIVLSQPFLKKDWSVYKQMVAIVHKNPAKFEVDAAELRPFEKLLWHIEGRLLDGAIFSSCVEQMFNTCDSDNFRVNVTKNQQLGEMLSQTTRQVLQRAENLLDTPGEMRADLTYVACCCLFVMHAQIFGVIDKRLFKPLWDLAKKCPVVCLVGNVCWCPTDFLPTRVPAVAKLLTAKMQSAIAADRDTWLRQRTQTLMKDVGTLQTQVISWMVDMQDLREMTVAGGGQGAPQQPALGQKLANVSSTLLKGLHNAQWLNNQIRRVMLIHAKDGKAITKALLITLCQLMELLKSIEYLYYGLHGLAASLAAMICQHSSLSALMLLQSVKKRFLAEKRNEKRMEVFSALTLVENCLSGPPTSDRLLVANVALCFGSRPKVFRDNELPDLNTFLLRLELMSTIYERFQCATSCDVLFWYQPVVPSVLKYIFDNPTRAPKLPYFFVALGDICPLMAQCGHLESPTAVLDAFKRSVLADLRQNLLLPLCCAIENDLRLHIHSHLLTDDRNPFRTGVRPLIHFVLLRPIRFCDESIFIKAEIELYLDRRFYDHTTVALHDWRTYDQMKNLARQIYRLDLVEPHLPTQTLEQGLDVLEIMRNIQSFVRLYLYNLNNQVFIERTSNNKHLNTINIRHIANSIRTHGTGIMNTTVNFTYQFLKRKFYIFSQFLYDEHIKSRLIKDWKYFRENHLNKDQKFPFKKAEEFNKVIRRLGVTQDGLSYLDRFRTLVTEIGNALAYIRMIRSGGLHCVSNAIRFLPDLEEVANFEELSNAAQLSEQTRRAAKNLDVVIQNLIKNFTEGTEYFKLLVDIFATDFRSEKNKHMQNFFIILPALTLNYIEYMIGCKEKLTRKNKMGSCFTDDGFAIGVAYVLKLLEQNAKFDSLHWFQSIVDHYAEEKRTTEQQRRQATSKGDEKLLQTLVLTLKRYDIYLHEFGLLNYALSSARIFFREKSVSSNSLSLAAKTALASTETVAAASAAKSPAIESLPMAQPSVVTSIPVAPPPPVL